MINTSKLVLTAALSVVLAGPFTPVGSAPASAQSLSHYGSPLPRYYDTEGTQHWGSWAPAAAEQKVAPVQRDLYLAVRPSRRHATQQRNVR